MTAVLLLRHELMIVKKKMRLQISEIANLLNQIFFNMSHGVDRSRFHICLIIFHDFVSVLTNAYDKHTSFNTHFPRFTLPPPTHTEWGEG